MINDMTPFMINTLYLELAQFIVVCTFFTHPPIHLLHSIKSVLCYEEEGPVFNEQHGP